MEYRKMKLSDLFTIGEMERSIFKQPWSVNSCRGAVENPCVYAVVAEDEDGIAGYGFMIGTQDEAEILRIAVLPEKRRNHIGSGLLEDMLDHGDYEGYSDIFLEVRESNTAAQALYEKAGFAMIGKRKDYYNDPKEDAVVMELVYVDEEE
ncbi:MAG: ribosomal protein S18-alanine N-acetyltransferase [Lachnospiraceae bacterium]|nr:ribosomal protein S18-alanine N-acetyltransferase [Lachnospiraceae bacterium]